MVAIIIRIIAVISLAVKDSWNIKYPNKTTNIIETAFHIELIIAMLLNLKE